MSVVLSNGEVHTDDCPAVAELFGKCNCGLNPSFYLERNLNTLTLSDAVSYAERITRLANIRHEAARITQELIADGVLPASGDIEPGVVEAVFKRVAKWGDEVKS